MTPQGNTRAASVADLMAIRDMKAAEFTKLCARLLAGDANTENVTYDTAALLARQPASGGEERRAPAGVCHLCGQTAEDERLNRKAADAFGFEACKGCIDQTLAARFGLLPERTPADVG